jgi:hypothetical protein
VGSADWQVVGYPDDPIPDDPGVVATQIAHLRTVAGNISTQVAALPQSGQVDALVWRSQNNDAPAQFRNLATQLPHDLNLLRTRYVKVADALDDFQPVLAQTKGEAQANLTVAVAAHQDMQAAQAGVTQMNDFNYQAQQAAANHNQNLHPGQSPVQPAPWSGPDYPAVLTDATTRYNRAKGNIDAAVQRFHGASQTAADRVNSASDDSLKNQSSGLWGLFDDVVKYGIGLGPVMWLWDQRHDAIFQEIDPILMKVSEWAGDISALAALVAMLPIPGVDVVADAISEAAGGVEALADTVVIATDDNAKDRSAAEEDLGWALLGIATAGGARVFGKDAELLNDVREAGDAVEDAKGAKVAAEADQLAKADDVAKADKLEQSEQALNRTRPTPTSYGRLTDAINDAATKRAALTKAIDEVSSAGTTLESAEQSSKDALKALDDFDGPSMAKRAFALDLPSAFKSGVQALKDGKVSYPLINLAANDGSTLGKLELGAGITRTVFATAGGAIGIKGLVGSMLSAESPSQ